uniref:Uncharacterized protein n=1 Tax=Opuntia streptacantha TaxID=393608 RepID=A0A7C9DEE7_OPUST
MLASLLLLLLQTIYTLPRCCNTCHHSFFRIISFSVSMFILLLVSFKLLHLDTFFFLFSQKCFYGFVENNYACQRTFVCLMTLTHYFSVIFMAPVVVIGLFSCIASSSPRLSVGPSCPLWLTN